MNLRFFSKIVATCLLLSVPTGCGDDLDAQQRTLDRFAGRNQTGAAKTTG
jgi:hypothetical protein